MKRVAITGARGLVGQALTPMLREAGFDVVELARRAQPGAVVWNPDGAWDASALEGVDAVVHLAGEPVGERWTDARKAAVMRSRREGTASLVAGILSLTRRPATLVSASAIGIYGDRGDEVMTEDSPAGSGFLADVVRAWEAAAAPARDAGLRVVHLRLGVVLSSRGGALPKMLLPFRLGLGGPLGSGRQVLSWVTLEDAARAFLFALTEPTMRGPYNLTAPLPVSSAELAAALGAALHRPAVLPVPAFAIRLLLGEMGQEMLLSGQRVSSARLQAAGFSFTSREIGDGLRRALRGA